MISEEQKEQLDPWVWALAIRINEWQSVEAISYVVSELLRETIGGDHENE